MNKKFLTTILILWIGSGQAQDCNKCDLLTNVHQCCDITSGYLTNKYSEKEVIECLNFNSNCFSNVKEQYDSVVREDLGRVLEKIGNCIERKETLTRDQVMSSMVWLALQKNKLKGYKTKFCKQQTTNSNNKIQESNDASIKKYHIVEAGQTLYRISVIYGVPVEELKQWNGLTTNEIKIGQKLIVKK